QYGGARPADDLAYAFLTTEMGGFDRLDAVEAALYPLCAIPVP
ncbi:MAG: hypothetical protein JWM47_3769, partial [Acidimicrobiales bacterium]|nr:hypothetical protein [Acidimicrobiales bacterium]